MDPLISVIIPIYNMEAYLARCLDSVLNNTYTNLEVICVDDGSKDSSPEILRSYAEKDSRIVPIFKENGGVSSARNAGLDRMTGKYVCFIDPDDYVHPQYVELLYLALKESGAYMSICGFCLVEDSNALTGAGSYTLDASDVCVLPFLQVFKTQDLRAYCWGKLFSGESLKNRRFREELLLAEDTAFVAEVCENTALTKAAVISCPLYFYFQREDSAVKVSKREHQLQFGKVWIQQLNRSDRDDIYLDKALHWYLSIGYVTTHILPDREASHECSKQLRGLCGRIRKTKIYSWKEKGAFLCFIRFPVVYWLYRSVKDPSMWKWERIERKKRREEKKNRTVAGRE